MNKIKHISSLQNPEVRQLEHWNRKSRDRRKSGKFVLEGVRELGLALAGGYRVDHLHFCPDIIELATLETTFDNLDCPRTSLSQEVYRHLAFRGKTEGVLAVVHAKSHELSDLKFATETPLILIAESPEKPGNVGALLRTADAAGVDAVIIADILGDLYNPNTIRSSVGCLFTVPVATASSQDILSWLTSRGIRLYAASLEGAETYHHIDFKAGCAIAVGTEATGLTEPWTKAADAAIIIPMQGAIDSLNVSVAAAVLIFEARRQRSL